jgi:hypothetical protein
MGWPLDLVGRRDREILERDPAPAVGRGQESVRSERNLAVRSPACIPAGTRRSDQAPPQRYIERAGAADHEIAPDAGFLGGADRDLRIADQEMDRADDRIVPGPQLRQGGAVVGVALNRGDTRQARDVLRVAGDSGNMVAPAGEFGGDARTGLARTRRC